MVKVAAGNVVDGKMTGQLPPASTSSLLIFAHLGDSFLPGTAELEVRQFGYPTMSSRDSCN